MGLHPFLRFLILLMLLSYGMMSCSKEENIPFKDSVRDTIYPNFYYKIDGNYTGKIYSVEFVKNGYYRIDSLPHSVSIEELDFDNVLLTDVSGALESNAQAFMFRANSQGGYLNFIPQTMVDSAGPDSVFTVRINNILNYFNGIYYYNSGALHYFMYHVDNGDTLHEEFLGYLD